MTGRCQVCHRRRGQTVQLGERDNVDRVGTVCPPCQMRLADLLRAVLAAVPLLRGLDNALAQRLLKSILRVAGPRKPPQGRP